MLLIVSCDQPGLPRLPALLSLPEGSSRTSDLALGPGQHIYAFDPLENHLKETF